MARGFRRTVRGVRCRLEPEEAMIIRRLAGELAEMIAVGTGAGPSDAPGEGGDGDGTTSSGEIGPASGHRDQGSGTGQDYPSVADLERLVGLPADPPGVPSDPVLRRLFPDAYADDEAAAEFRRFAQGDLSTGKLAALATMQATIDDRGGTVSLDDDAAQAWLTGLNDLRLALGTLVGVDDDNADELSRLPRDDPRAGLFDVYDFLTYLQETLVTAVAGW